MNSKYELGVLVGDGIGPEIVPAAVQIIDAAASTAGIALGWTALPICRTAIETHGTATPPETLDALTGLDAWILGPHDSAAYPEPHRSALNPSGTIRKHFQLFANIRPAKAFPGGGAIVEGTDLLIVRENTEGFYADRNTYAGTGEMMPTPDVAIMHGIITREATTRIAHEAFQLAMLRRRQLTIVHKANVLRLTTGLFRDVCLEVGREYPKVKINDFHIDAMTAHLVRRVTQFDVIVTENMFGDILSDLAGEIAGSLGIAPSINASHTQAMAQAAHGSAPDLAGQNKANPIAMILSGAMLLRWLGMKHDDLRLSSAADAIDRAVQETVLAGVKTADLGGNARTSEFSAFVTDLISEI